MKQRIVNTGEDSDNTASMAYLKLVIASESPQRFFSLFSLGFSITTKAGCSINDLLNRQLGIAEAYIDDRIQTIFLNGRAVDDSKSATLREGATLALSAAMPGMVGSTFRKGGVFAGMRSQISHLKDKAGHRDLQIKVKIKLFNLIARELGPVFLRKGVIIDGNAFQNFVSDNLEDLRAACASIHLNDTKISVSRLKELKWADREVFLQVISEKSP
jgi:hypothetical protein